MDDIQKVLVKAGRKDLAQDYYRKVTGKATTLKEDYQQFKIIKKSFLGSLNMAEHSAKTVLDSIGLDKKLLNKIKDVKEFKKQYENMDGQFHFHLNNLVVMLNLAIENYNDITKSKQGKIFVKKSK